MILTKEEIDKIKKKIVIELTFDYSMTSPDVECKYQLFYDDGQGLKSDKLDIIISRIDFITSFVV